MRRNRKKIRHLNSVLRIILSSMIIIGSLAGFFPGSPVSFEKRAFAEEISTNAPAPVMIETEEDFLELARNSGDDSYTEGRTFILKNDLNLSGRKVEPVQTFCGYFDGGGHTIYGFSYRGKLSNIGLFRVISEYGEVRDLDLEFSIIPTGDMHNIGGIAGVNAGRIEGCTVKGILLGMEAVGGIAGRNTETGKIRDCENTSNISGMRRTGGIAGYNEGLIENCRNKGEINTDSKTAWEQDDERKKEEEDKLLEKGYDEDETDVEEKMDKLIYDTLDIGYDDLKDFLRSEHEVHYTGGIAGANSGTVRDSVNHANVGYNHLGYKTGGIVGYERGILFNCLNNGSVRGRKSTGGIAGQLEPYERDDFSKDSLEKAQDMADKLVGQIIKLQESAKNEDDNVQQRIDSIRDSADGLRGSISDYKDYYRGKDDAMEAEMREHTGAIRDVINSMDLNLKVGKTNDAITGIQDDVERLIKLTKGAEKAVSGGVPVDIKDYLGTARGISKDLDKQTVTLLEEAKRLGKEYNDLRDDAKRLRDQNNYFDDFLRKAYDSYKGDLRGTDDDLTARTDTIADQMDALSDTLKSADKVLRGQMDGVVDSIQVLSDEINNGFDEARNEIDRMRNNKSINDIFDDISDTDDPSPGKGKITGCENRGDIITDINGGGIVGMADTDLDLWSDLETYSSGDVSLVHKKTKLAAIVGCINRGAVTVKNNCAGGIAGNLDIGAVEGSKNFGPVRSTDGDFAGGIAGRSGYMIRDSFSMAAVSGNVFIGGVAGQGNSLLDNMALSTISPGVKEKYGSIAGFVDRDDDEYTISGNIYVNNELGAINGLTFENEAKGVSYDEFVKIPGVPDETKEMTVTFMADDKVVGTLKVPYGGTVPPEDYPEIPDEEDKFGVWENSALENIRQNTIVDAVFYSYVTTIASKEALPEFLITGKFFSGTGLDHKRTDIKEGQDIGKVPDGYLSPVSKYEFNITSELDQDIQDTSIRILADDYKSDDGYTAAVKSEDGSFSVIATEKDGRYLVFPFDCSQRSGEFYILKAAPGKKKTALVGTVIGLLALMIIIQIIRKYRKKPVTEEKKQ